MICKICGERDVVARGACGQCAAYERILRALAEERHEQPDPDWQKKVWKAVRVSPKDRPGWWKRLWRRLKR